MATSLCTPDSALCQTVMRELHDATLAMKRSIPVPDAAASRFYDVCRSEPRRMHLMGAYPDIAFIFAAHGAPFVEVCQPMTTLRSLLWDTHYRDRLPSLHEAQQLETEAQGDLDVWQLIVAESPTPTNTAAAMDSLNRHIGSLRVLRAVYESVSHKRIS